MTEDPATGPTGDGWAQPAPSVAGWTAGAESVDDRDGTPFAPGEDTVRLSRSGQQPLPAEHDAPEKLTFPAQDVQRPDAASQQPVQPLPPVPATAALPAADALPAAAVPAGQQPHRPSTPSRHRRQYSRQPARAAGPAAAVPGAPGLPGSAVPAARLHSASGVRAALDIRTGRDPAGRVWPARYLAAWFLPAAAGRTAASRSRSRPASPGRPACSPPPPTGSAP